MIMPNRRTHQAAGAIAGAGYSTTLTSGRPGQQRLIEAIGTAVGGLVSGRWPDILDPPNYPGHRGPGHALIPNLVAAYLLHQYGNQWSNWCRTQANQFQLLSYYAVTKESKAQCLANAQGYHLLAGIPAGLIAGLWSHLALDFTTPAGLPLI
ncbi:MAG: hypothetical protein C0393_02190 [Anaerolinea sp.]|nr:hypothetical protein [Anaerolinea sp.]